MSVAADNEHVTLSSVHLDAIRGGAAVVVLLGHTRDLFFTSWTAANEAPKPSTGQVSKQASVPEYIAPRITTGAEAVMVFFVLSGYLVGGSVLTSIRRNRWSWRTYLTKRLTRLWVVLLPALLLGVAIDTYGLHHLAGTGSIYSGSAQQAIVDGHVQSRLSASVIMGNMLFLQGIRVGTAGSNDSLWSLTNEFWYYIAFPLALLSFSTARAPWFRARSALLLIALGFLVGSGIVLLFPIWILGALISVAPLRLSPALAGRLLGGSAVFLPVLLLLIRRAGLSLYLAQWLVALFFAMTLYVLLHQTGRAGNGIYRAVAGFLSRISYSLYVVHLPLAVLLCAAVNRPWHHWQKSSENLLMFLGLNAFIVLVSYLFYLLFESNTDRIRGLLSGRRVSGGNLPTSIVSRT